MPSNTRDQQQRPEAASCTQQNPLKTHTKHKLAGNHLLLSSLPMISLVISLNLLLITSPQLVASQLGDLLLGAQDGSSQQDGSKLAPNSHQNEILVQPNSQVRIECKLPVGQPGGYHWNFLGSSPVPRLLFFEDRGVAESQQLGYQLEFDRESGSYGLLIKNATYEQNDGVYFCVYLDPDTKQQVTREFRLTVLIPPQPPTITSAQTPAREAADYQLNCVTMGGNPEPNISWFRNEQPLVSSSAARIEQSRLNGTTTSVLSWKPTTDDHQAEFKCSIWNKAMSATMSNLHQLYVEYAPRISVGAHNPLKVVLGRPVTLPCAVDANPPVKSVRWFRNGQLVSNQFNYTIPDVQASDAATYTCQADNGIPSPLAARQSPDSPSFVEAQLQLQVLFGPQVSVKVSKSSPLVEGESVTLSCAVESSPPPHEFVWTKADDPNFRAKSQNSVLLSSVSARDMGNYTCTAFNRMEPSDPQLGGPVERHASASALVLVKHKPGQAEISLGQSGETELGLKTFVQCRAKPPGYPEPQYKFWRYSANNQRVALKNQHHGPTYTIHAAKPDDEARYGCVAANDMGSSLEADGELIVNEPPNIIVEATSRTDDTRAPGDHPYSIMVRASGKPEPKVSWFHRSPVDGRRVELSGLEMQSKFRIETASRAEQHHIRPKFNVITTLHFRAPLEVDDRGLYWAEFSNGLSKAATETLQLHIHHTPVPAPRNQPILAAQPLQQQPTRVRSGFNPGESVNLTCLVSAYPQPSFQWFSPSMAAVDTSSRYRTSVTNPRDDVWESTLSFDKVQEADYGEYSCLAVNSNQRTKLEAEARTVVELTRKSLPEPPSQLEVIDANQDSVTIQWVPGFDGGYPNNQFLVQYAPDDGSKLSLGKRFPNADAAVVASSEAAEYQSASQLRLYECLSMNPCTINQLQQRQPYVFRLRAKNELGLSEFSDELRASTRASISQIPRISDASFDQTKNILYFRVESNPDYALINLDARIEVHAASNELQQSGAEDEAEWRHHATVHVRQERAEAYLNMQQEVEQLRITLCSRSNESLCGPRYVVSMKSAVSSFLQGERGVSLNLLALSLMLVVVLAGFASALNTCCSARSKAKQADTIERTDGSTQIDNKPLGSGNGHLVHGTNGSHGSTASTRSTSVANGNGGSQLHSMDSINGNGISGYAAQLANGAVSDHSSDHSRQVKLDSKLPPNYSHYMGAANLIHENQQLEGADKLSSHFGLPNSALLSVAQQLEPPMSGAQFGYGNAGAGLEQHHSMMEHNSMMLNSMLEAESQQQQQLWQSADDYAGYNALAGYADQQQQQVVEPTYGTSGGVIMSQQSAAYDNSANSGQQQYYLGTYQQQQQFQQELAAAQQSVYGTLTRAGYATGDNLADDSNGLESQQQQQYITNSATSGLMQQQQLAPPPPPPQESDYGTSGGGRGGRLIREIIV